MKTVEEITHIERQYCDRNGIPSLGKAFTLLRERWHAGERDRETSLRLLFLVWYSCAEPTFLTGLPALPDPGELFTEVFDSLGGVDSNDPEVCLVVSLMAELFPYCLGDESRWLSIASELRERYKQISPQGLSHDHFTDRGAYGHYFAHMTSTH